MRYLLPLLVLGCGQQQLAIVKVQSALALTPDQRAKCPQLPAFVDRVKARLIVEGLEATPCPLTVGLADADTLRVTGECRGIPVGGRPLFRLEWYAVSPSGKEIRLAESRGNAPLEEVSQPSVEVPFGSDGQSNLKPKTKATSLESLGARDTYNCDRTGTDVCDSMNPAPANASDVDTCSNLEELCKDTLFAGSIDQCP